MASHLKAFKKTVGESLFKVVIVDSINVHRGHYEEFWNHAKAKGMEVYVVELKNDLKVSQSVTDASMPQPGGVEEALSVSSQAGGGSGCDC